MTHEVVQFDVLESLNFFTSAEVWTVAEEESLRRREDRVHGRVVEKEDGGGWID